MRRFILAMVISAAMMAAVAIGGVGIGHTSTAHAAWGDGSSCGCFYGGGGSWFW